MIYEWVVEPPTDPGDVLNRQGVALSLRWAVVQKAENPVGGHFLTVFLWCCMMEPPTHKMS